MNAMSNGVRRVGIRVCLSYGLGVQRREHARGENRGAAEGECERSRAPARRKDRHCKPPFEC